VGLWNQSKPFGHESAATTALSAELCRLTGITRRYWYQDNLEEFLSMEFEEKVEYVYQTLGGFKDEILLPFPNFTAYLFK